MNNYLWHSNSCSAHSFLFLKCDIIRTKLPITVTIIDNKPSCSSSAWWISCNKSAEPNIKIPIVPVTTTLMSPCFLHPNTNATSAHGNMKYIKASWNSWLARNEYGATIKIAGKKTQWIAHSEDMVMPKLSMIFCIVVLCIMHKLSKNDSIFM